MRVQHTPFIACVAWLGGCATDLPPVWHIDEPRVIGMRADVAGQTDVASISPGDRVTARWFVATPDGAPAELAWSLAACPSNVARCDAVPAAESDGAGSVPTIEIDVPTLDEDVTIAVAGTVCDASSMADGACRPGRPGATQVAASLRRTRGLPNHNPALEGTLAIKGVVWTATGGCDDPATTTVSASTELGIDWTASEHDREWFDGGRSPLRETLQLSTFVTAGDLEDHFAIIESNDVGLTHTIRWTAPTATDLRGAATPVHFTFVLRDGRGGIDAATRTLCILP